MNLKNKTVLVTGSSKGIGRAIAIAFANEGANVVINYRNSEKEASEVYSLIEKTTGNHSVVQADVSNEADVKKLFADIKAKYKTIDILINNAGYSTPEDPAKTDITHWKDEMDNTFFDTVLCTKEFLNMEGSETLRKVINISSLYGFGERSSKSYIAYSAAKGAVNNFTVLMAKKYAPNILINAIAPGYVLAPSWGEMTKEEEETYAKEQLIERFIMPEEIADGVIFMAKNDSMTGTILIMDGGLGLKTV